MWRDSGAVKSASAWPWARALWTSASWLEGKLSRWWLAASWSGSSRPWRRLSGYVRCSTALRPRIHHRWLPPRYSSRSWALSPSQFRLGAPRTLNRPPHCGRGTNALRFLLTDPAGLCAHLLGGLDLETG